MSNQLKPCPFCRNADQDEFSTGARATASSASCETADEGVMTRLLCLLLGNRWLICDSCGAYFGSGSGVAEEHWNRRPTEDDLHTRLAAAEERAERAEREMDEARADQDRLLRSWQSAAQTAQENADEGERLTKERDEARTELERVREDAGEALSDAVRAINSIYDAAQFCDCSSFGVASDWRNRWHGGEIALAALSRTSPQPADEAPERLCYHAGLHGRSYFVLAEHAKSNGIQETQRTYDVSAADVMGALEHVEACRGDEPQPTTGGDDE